MKKERKKEIDISQSGKYTIHLCSTEEIAEENIAYNINLLHHSHLHRSKTLNVMAYFDK